MLFNKERELVFGLHAKAASRWLERIFMRRGFKIIGARHEGPRNLHQQLDMPIERVWWDTNPLDCDYAFVVRNHGDALLSWWSTFKEVNSEWDQDKVCARFLAEWPRQYPRLFLGSRRLWRFVWEIPGASILRFESLTKDVNRYLIAYDLGRLEEWELRKDPKHVTTNKPLGPWVEHFTPEGLDYLKEAYRAEAMQLGYRLHGESK